MLLAVGRVHGSRVFLQRQHLLHPGRTEEQQVFQQFRVSAEIAVGAEFKLAAEGVEEALVFFALRTQHGQQLAFDLLFQGGGDELQLMILLQHFPGQVQAHVFAVYQPAYKAEIVRQQIGAFFRDQHAGGIEGQPLFKFAAVIIVGCFPRQEEQGGIADPSLGPAEHSAGRRGEIVEPILVIAVVILLRDLARVLFPQRGHAVEDLVFSIVLVFLLPVGGRVGRPGQGAALVTQHADGVAHVVAVTLDDVRQAPFFQIIAVTVGLRVFPQLQDDVGADLLFFSGRDRIALDAAAFPFPGLVRVKSAADNSHLVRHHECGIKTYAELTDDVDILALIGALEVLTAAFGNCAQIGFQLLFVHAAAVVAYGQGTGCLVRDDAQRQLLSAQTDLFPVEAGPVAFVQRVGSVADQLPQEYLLVRINGVDHHFQQLLAFRLEFPHLSLLPSG